MRTLFCFIVSLACLSGRASDDPAAAARKLARCMTGAFANAHQARGDQNFHEIVLHTAQIWPERTDGSWLYSEHALADAPNHPFRQTVYQIVAQPDGGIEARVFSVPDPVRVTGAWKNPAAFASLDPAALIAREGCTLYFLVQPDGSFRGTTRGEGCASSINGARYAIGEATVAERELFTWDRGFNARGAQVWGSIHGGYRFTRVD